MIEFIPYPKTPRLFRDIVITEKIDGTNAGIQIESTDLPDGVLDLGTQLVVDGFLVTAQSRKRLIYPHDDNFGFARWMWDNASALVQTLAEGVHFGEWWGSGIQSSYGLPKGEKRFSLFNVGRWEDVVLSSVPGLHVVPTLYKGVLSDDAVDIALTNLRINGSYASPGFDRPEGVVVFHTASRQVYKVLLENDEIPKGLVNA